MSTSQNVAFISASGAGIGRATALELARKGYVLVVTDINDKAGQETVALIEKTGGTACFLHHDVSDFKDWERIAEEVKKRYGKLNFLYNNAGIGVTAVDIQSTTPEDFDNMMRITSTSAFYGCKVFADMLLEQGAKGNNASVVNSSSIYGIIGGVGERLAYCTAKGAVRTMTKNLALAWAKKGVRVNSIHPGYVETKLLVDGVAAGGGDTAKSWAALEASVPMGRVGRPEEIAKCVAFLASDDASYVTGLEFVADGGYIAA